MAKPLFRGAAVALVTPFTNGKVDFEALRKLTRMQLEAGTAAIVVCGTTGEPATMTKEEKVQVIREVVAEVNGRIPVICGTGSNCTASVVETEKLYRDLGCDAQLVVTPYYNKTTQEGLYAHFMHIAENTELPIILYNVPSRTALDLGPATLARLAECDRFIGLKESSNDLSLVMEKMAVIDGRMALYSGNDDLVYNLLTLKGDGVISVVSNILPGAMNRICESFFAGDYESSLQEQVRILPLVRALFSEVSPIPVKYAVEQLGLCSGEVRLPLIPAGEKTREMLMKAMAELGMLKA
ncbi:MAG: 4-hydroxy-tetrahydrodipicolinate synthase [Clostridiales bacterium]|nr:4-hydroxy-tetrahydrodipicolinate synthase [Clostridiales bacterium]